MGVYPLLPGGIGFGCLPPPWGDRVRVFTPSIERLGLGLGVYPLFPPVAESAEGPIEVSPAPWVENLGFGVWDLGFKESLLSAPRERDRV